MGIIFTLLPENYTSSLFYKIGLNQERLNNLSDEGQLFNSARINPMLTASAYRASHSLSDVLFDFDSAAVTASALTGSLTSSDLTFIQFVGREVEENIFFSSFYQAYGNKVGHEGLETDNFDETQKLINFHEGLSDNKVQSVINLISQSRDENPEDIPGFFHVVGVDGGVSSRGSRCPRRFR